MHEFAAVATKHCHGDATVFLLHNTYRPLPSHKLQSGHLTDGFASVTAAFISLSLLLPSSACMAMALAGPVGCITMKAHEDELQPNKKRSAKIVDLIMFKHHHRSVLHQKQDGTRSTQYNGIASYG